jgi:hypothetical protein
MMTLSRRRVLQGSALALGSSVVARFVRNAQAGSGKPARVVIVVEGNGVYPRAFLSDAARLEFNRNATKAVDAWTGGATDRMNFDDSYARPDTFVLQNSNLSTAKCLGPLAEQGLLGKAAVLLGLSSTISGGGHSSYQGGLSCTRGNERETPAATIDAVLAPRLQAGAPFDAVRLGVDAGDARISYQLCAYGGGRPAPISLSPTDAYNRLFRAIVGGAGDPKVAERQGALAWAEEDVNAALSTFSGPAKERAKLENYRTAIRESQLRQQKLVALAGTALSRVPAAPTGLADDLYTSSDPMDRLEAQFNLAAASLLGGLTNVAVLASGPGGGLGLNYQKVLRSVPGWDPREYGMNRHVMQHGIGEAINREGILAVTRKHVELIAAFAKKLDVPESGTTGTYLDHTIIVFMSDNGEQHHSLAKEWPILLLGGKALGMKTDGRTVIYPGLAQGANRRQVSNLFNTLGHATGDTTMNKFGGEGAGRFIEGPLGGELFAPVP